MEKLNYKCPKQNNLTIWWYFGNDLPIWTTIHDDSLHFNTDWCRWIVVMTNAMVVMAIFLPAHFHFDTFHRYMLLLCTLDPWAGATEKNILHHHLRLCYISILFFLHYSFFFSLEGICPFELSYNLIDSHHSRYIPKYIHHQKPHCHYCFLQNIKVFCSYILLCVSQIGCQCVREMIHD